MKTILIQLIAALASLLINDCLAKTTETSDSLEKALAMEIPVWMAEFHVPCVGVGVIDNGKLTWIKVFGNLQNSVPAPKNTLFNIASQTKPVVALLTLKLVQSKNWNLDEPLAKYWIDPDIAGDPYLQKLTTRLVLSHQTGFANWRSDNGVNKLQFNAEPGTKFGYSGEGFEYLRRALENKFQQPLEKLLDSLLFKPLGMNDTRYWGKNIDSGRLAQWHNGQGKRYETSTETPVSAADDLITTVEDYCKLGIFTMNGADMPPTLFSEMVEPLVKTKENYFRGLGWGVVENLADGAYALEHGGSDIGVRTMAIFLPKSKSGIVVMTNGDNGMYLYDRIIKQALPNGVKILETMNKGAATHERIVLADELIQTYSGEYQQENGKIMTVVKEGNAVKVSGDGIPTAVLFPESQNKFFLPDYDVQLEFPDENSLVVYESGKKVMRIRRINARGK